MKLLFLALFAGLFCVPALAQDQDPNTKIPVTVPRGSPERLPEAWCNLRDDNFDPAKWVESVGMDLPYYDFRPGTIDLDLERTVDLLIITVPEMVWRSDAGDEVPISDVVPYHHDERIWRRPTARDPVGTILRYEMPDNLGDLPQLNAKLPRFKFYTDDILELDRSKVWSTKAAITCYTLF